ncbi:hypothetical protein ERO13_D09G014850v2 [Gossypium hirsutum]|uniref:Uncharacterized protein n=4 Tax=Gossypium TaxID=3633 RepID=A0A5J5PY20_GOSBA|nr:hypothetical protein ES319_D09G016700v1 [Gossypium barbadense]KAG4128332.1 hypothetical protein ERO13_D09G014850v2 [Gossypium hirsutum]TYG52338.1 hypothetical protein ES288_D09G018800v1 [Gossypium darwinii]TYH52319.1 hypothetical protein ES332_D09G018500v1 [Gossypium tomentosum]TYI63428.1 hypothetical protein E1A91_D09G016800v1 [Gossypium mustelinum]
MDYHDLPLITCTVSKSFLPDPSFAFSYALLPPLLLLFPLLSAKISFKYFLVLHFLNCPPCPSVLSSPSDTAKLLASSSSANMAFLDSRCPRIVSRITTRFLLMVPLVLALLL